MVIGTDCHGTVLKFTEYIIFVSTPNIYIYTIIIEFESLDQVPTTHVGNIYDIAVNIRSH